MKKIDKNVLSLLSFFVILLIGDLAQGFTRRQDPPPARICFYFGCQ